MKNKSLQNRRIAITGGARGIGLATAALLHRLGATVIIGDLDAASAIEAAAAIGPDVQAYPLDVSDRESFAAFIKQATASGPLDVLVNNAGIMPIGAFLEQSADVHRRAVEINVLGCLYGMYLALPAMVGSGSGHIINVASTAGKTPVPGGLTYCGTKAAVVALTETARVEYSGSGVRFTCILPHFTNTELIAGTTATKLIPVVEPDDVAAAIADAIVKPRADVYVPGIVGLVISVNSLIGRRLRDFLSRRLGAYDTFLKFDKSARASYTRRITQS
ncbi:SDR family oxidoreductase [Nocardia sp. NPDC059246]|uniref:SDR family oxidoreductase n=1 Tax=unclassified Nocardia TaxID=2637762 RepID=UPI0036A81C95